MQVQLIKYIATIITSGLVACGGFPTTHPDTTKNNASIYKTDLQDCKQSYPESPEGVYLKQRINCLKLKGWQ